MSLSLGLSLGVGGSHDSAPPVPKVPTPFTAGMWAIADAATGGTLTVTINSLPSDRGSEITDIEYTLDDGETWLSSGGIVSFEITGLDDGVAQSVQLRAVNGIGAGAASDTKIGTPTLPIPAPEPPTIALTKIPGGFSVDWTDGDLHGGTVLERTIYGQKGGGERVALATLPGDAGSPYVVDGLDLATEYSIDGTTTTNGGTSDPSNVVTETTFGLPGAIQSLSVTVDDDDMSSTWLAPESNGGSAITDYRCEMSQNGGAWTLPLRFPSATPSFAISNLDDGVWRLRVAAVTAVGQGPWTVSDPFAIGEVTTPITYSVDLAEGIITLLGGPAGWTFTVQADEVDIGSIVIEGTLDASGHRGAILRIKGTNGSDTIYSDEFVLDTGAAVAFRADFSSLPDQDPVSSPVEGLTIVGAGQVQILDGALHRHDSTAATLRRLHNVTYPEVEFTYQGDQATENTTWYLGHNGVSSGLNVTFAGGTAMRFSVRGPGLTNGPLTNFKVEGSNVSPPPGSVMRFKHYINPVDSKPYVQVYYNGLAQIEGAGYDVSTYTGTGKNFQASKAAGPTVGSGILSKITIRDTVIASNIFVQSVTPVAPSPSQGASLSIEALIDESIENVEILLTDDAGTVIDAVRSFAVDGDPFLYEMDDSVQGQTAIVVIRNAADHDDFTKYSIGVVSYFAPAAEKFLFGQNLMRFTTWGPHYWEDLGVGIRAQYYTADAAAVPVTTAPVAVNEYGFPTGEITAEAQAASATHIRVLAYETKRRCPKGLAGTWSYTLPDMTGFTVGITKPGPGTGNALAGTVTLTEEAEYGNLIWSITPNSPENRIAGGLRMVFTRNDSTTKDNILNQAVMTDYAGRNIVRLYQATQGFDRAFLENPAPEWPFVDQNPACYPEVINQMAAESGVIPWITLPLFDTIEKCVEYVVIWSKKWKAYLDNPLIDESKKYRGPVYVEPANELWNFAVDYFWKYRAFWRVAANGGFFNLGADSWTGDILLDDQTQAYVKTDGTTLLTPMTQGQRIMIRARETSKPENGRLVIIEALEDVEAGVAIPQPIITRNATANGIKVIAGQNDMWPALRRACAYFGAYATRIMNTGVVPDNDPHFGDLSHLSDPEAAAGDVFRPMCATGANDSLATITDILMQGGAGNELARDYIAQKGGWGGGFYMAHLYTWPQTDKPDWVIAIEEERYDDADALDSWFAYMEGLGDGMVNSLRSMRHDFYRVLKAAGIEGWIDQILYEGGEHLSVNAPAPFEKISAFWQYQNTQPRQRELIRDYYRALYEIGLEGLLSFCDYEFPISTGTINVQMFGILYLPGKGGDADQQRSLGEADILQELIDADALVDVGALA